MSNLAGEIQVSPKTVANWLDILERMYLLFIESQKSDPDCCKFKTSIF